jgi:hypothetical protein
MRFSARLLILLYCIKLSQLGVPKNEISWIQLEQKQNVLLNAHQRKVEFIIRFTTLKKLTARGIGHSTNLKQNKHTNLLFYMSMFKNRNV